MKISFAVALALSMGLSAWGQQNPQQPFPPFKVDYVKVDRAIENGVKYLKSSNSAHLAHFEHAGRQMQNCELVLYTYVHADVPDSDPAFKELFDDMMKRKLEATYCTALQAMILEEIGRAKYQGRIAQCAQFLVDNQCGNGMWTYGDPSIFVEDIPTTAPKKDVASSGGKARSFDSLPPPGMRAKEPKGRPMKVEKKRDGPASGDNSNTQYAALGLRACHDSNIQLPAAVIDKAMQWWRTSQKDDKNAKPETLVEGGVNGPEGGAKGGTVASSRAEIKAAPQGWCYGQHDHEAYGSMSGGAVGSLAIYNYIKDNDDGKKRSWKKDKDIHEGLVWLAKNFSVTYNPGPYEHGGMENNSQHQYYYYLYALERAGMLYGTEIMGTHEWYPEGAKVLIESQKADGSWTGGVVNTCFAILFLKRATRPLDVATHSAGSMRK